MIDFTLLQAWAIGLLPFALGFLVVMLLDFITGALLAWYVGDFDWETAPRFLQTGVVYLWAWLTSEILAVMPTLFKFDLPGYGEAIASVGPKLILAGIVLGKYLTSIVTNIKAIVAIRNAHPWDGQPKAPGADAKG